MEDIFQQEARFISSSPLHTPHPFEASSNSKKIENLDIDFDFRPRNSTDEITLPNPNNSNSNQARSGTSSSGTFVDNAAYLEFFTKELCRLFRIYFAHCADLQTTNNLEALIRISNITFFHIIK